MRSGAFVCGNTCRFVVWAPHARSMELKLTAPDERVVPLARAGDGYWEAAVPGVAAGTRYLYRIDGANEKPDPASHCQPDGVHAPSQVIDHDVFVWSDGSWKGIPLEEMIVYELHVGTFTPEGTFRAAIARLDDLLGTGVNAVEIMPVAQFPGSRNWGYDGAYPYAVQHSYGGPDGLKEFVDAAHRKGIAVILDVVYNHLGPEGNYLSQFGPYFTAKYRTPWGNAVNFDDADNRGVRDYFTENALFWFDRYHIDALRLDAIHGIFDASPTHILKELAEKTAAFSKTSGRKRYLVAESDLNQSRVIREWGEGGYGIDGQWNDDFHHAVHTLLTGERSGYYVDFGRTDDMRRALAEGYVYSGQDSAFRQKEHGDFAGDIPPWQFVIFDQNHDQVGNRKDGERLSVLTDFKGLKLAAGAVLLAPYVPLLFMGEEYAEDNPFLYFVSHGDPGLIQAVREGRKKEFGHFGWASEPADPQSEETFRRSVLLWEKRKSGQHKTFHEYCRELIRLRKAFPALGCVERKDINVLSGGSEGVIILCRERAERASLCVMNFTAEPATVRIGGEGAVWKKAIDAADSPWGGPGATLPETVHGPVDPTIGAHGFAAYLLAQ